MKMYEQADKGIHYFHYSWLLDGISGRQRKQMTRAGWKWLRGHRSTGCYCTTDKRLAQRWADQLGVAIESNGTHAVIGAPMSTSGDGIAIPEAATAD